jgi:predicted AlkP superfamily pyrophosphatase or phosphodiesterase
MKRFLLACLNVAFIFGLTLSPTRAADPNAHVIVVCIDGLASYLIKDNKAPLPTVRELAKHGAIAEDGMSVANPAVTWPNHTTLITGVRPLMHGVLANGVLVRGVTGALTVVDPNRDGSELVRGKTIVDIAHANGLRTAEINWPCMRNSKSVDDSFSDVPNAVEYMTPRLRSELIAAGILKDETHASFASNSPVVKDLIWTEAACHVIRLRKPNLMMIHLLNVDTTHHANGPQTGPGYTANGYADMCLSKIVDAIDDAGIRPQTTIMVVSDHGFMSTPNAICPNVLLKQQGLLTEASGKIVSAQVHVISEGGIGLIYCTNPANAKELTDKVKKLFEGQGGVASVLLPDRFAEYGIPHPREYAQAPDAILVAADGYTVANTVEGDTFINTSPLAKASLGSHGFLSTTSQMNATFVASGRGIRDGVKLKDIRNVDIAPTIASLLQLDGLQYDGHVISDALTQTR